MKLILDLSRRPLIRTTPEERFWSKVDKSGACWLWTASKNTGGYGGFRLEGRKRLAHRVSYAWAYGHVPEGLKVDHKCHVRNCVRPDHLRVVTTKQNMENRSGPTVRSKSRVLGVSWKKASRKWVARVRHEGKLHHVGLFDTIEAASYAVTTRRNELFTHNDLDRSTQ